MPSDFYVVSSSFFKLAEGTQTGEAKCFRNMQVDIEGAERPRLVGRNEGLLLMNKENRMSALQIERVGATALLTMNRPAQRNALDLTMREEFAHAIAEVRDDLSVRAVVLTGAGGHFCAGGDIKTIAENIGKSDLFEGRERIRKLHRWYDELVDLEKPVIAAVNGVAYGAGLSLMLAADFVLASPNATFCSVFARLGFVPDMGAMYLLPRAVGLARAKDIVFSARVVSAREAMDIGLVQQICDVDVLQAALDFAERFHTAPTEALGIVKSIMNHAFESERRSVYAQEAMAQAMCRESAFHQEAVRRFLAKEPAEYHWSDAGQ